ncbi:MAG: GDSL-type esterase/lipase family protein [Limisphaerales bacterium]
MRHYLILPLLALTLAAQELTPPAKPEAKRAAAGTITLTCPTPGAVIRYSIDGSDPGPKGGPYLAPIVIPSGGMVKARAYSEDRKVKSDMFEAKFEAVAGAKPLPSTLVPCTQDRDFPIYDWAKRHAAVTKIAADRNASLVFIGDSITQMFGGEPHDRSQPGKAVWEKHYAKRNVANLGFGYDYLENTLWRLRHGELDGAKAKVVVIHIGTNNAGKNTPEEIALGVGALLDEIRQRQPQAHVILMAIFPRGPKPDAMRAKLDTTNKLLAQFAVAGKVTFLDIGAKFLQPDGTITREVMGDFLHPSAKGYEIWAEAIEPLLVKLLGEGR